MWSWLALLRPSMYVEGPDQNEREKAIKEVTAIGGPCAAMIIAKALKRSIIAGVAFTQREEGYYRADLMLTDAIRDLGQVAIRPIITNMIKNWGRYYQVLEQGIHSLNEIDPNWVKTEAGALALSYLIDALHNKDSNIRAGAAKAMGELKDTRSVDPLIVLFQDKEYHVRVQAAESLGKLKDSRSVDPLIALLQDDVSNVRMAAFDALGCLGGRRLTNPAIDFEALG